MKTRLKVLLVVLVGVVLLTNLLNFYAHAIPWATPPASAADLQNLRETLPR